MSAQKKRSKRKPRKQKERNLGQKQAEEQRRSESKLSQMGEIDGACGWADGGRRHDRFLV
jgi:hypothetical protein